MLNELVSEDVVDVDVDVEDEDAVTLKGDDEVDDELVFIILPLKPFDSIRLARCLRECMSFSSELRNESEIFFLFESMPIDGEKFSYL